MSVFLMLMPVFVIVFVSVRMFTFVSMGFFLCRHCLLNLLNMFLLFFMLLWGNSVYIGVSFFNWVSS